MREGKMSPRYGNLGVYNVCLGPDAPIPNLRGPRMKVVIYDREDNVVRRLEEVKGENLQPGYVSFFESECRPSIDMYYVVDIDPATEQQTIMMQRTSQRSHYCTMEEWIAFVGKWAQEHGVPQAKGGE